jgi:hypothetical protein
VVAARDVQQALASHPGRSSSELYLEKQLQTARTP